MYEVTKYKVLKSFSINEKDVVFKNTIIYINNSKNNDSKFCNIFTKKGKLLNYVFLDDLKDAISRKVIIKID